MEKNQKQYWENTISNMNSDNQLELAKILIEELHLKEDSQDKSDNYDMMMSTKLRSILEVYANRTSVKIEKQKILDLIDKFTNLSPVNKKKITDSVILQFIDVMDDFIKKDKFSSCSKEGHAYGDNSWKRHEWKTYKTIYIDHQEVPNYPIKHVNWTRKCLNCGFTEETTIEPLKVKEQREKDEKQAKIKELKKELKDLSDN